MNRRNLMRHSLPGWGGLLFVMATFHLFTHHHCFTALFTILEAESAPFPPQSFLSFFLTFVCRKTLSLSIVRPINVMAAICSASPDTGRSAFLEEGYDLRSSAADVTASQRGVRSRPKSIYTRQFHDDRNRGLSRTQGRGGAGARPSCLGVMC